MNPSDDPVRCPHCRRLFIGVLALDVHRRRSPACRYEAGERAPGYRPGLYATAGRSGG